MPLPLIRYGLDLTGTNRDNFVTNEIHDLAPRRNRAAAPTYGAYFADSLVVTETTTNRVLTRGIHYVPIELYQTLSLTTGKDIFGALLVIDINVISPISINYQVVGGEYSRSTQPLIDLLNKIPDDRQDYSWFDVLNKPETFNPAPHFHPLGDGVGFEYVVYALERIRNAIIWADSPMYQNLINYINDTLKDLDARLKYQMDSYLDPKLRDFKAKLNKAFIGLGKVENLKTATDDEGTLAAKQDTRVSNFQERKYALLTTLVAFKHELYQRFVSVNDTNIGKQYGTLITPTKDTFFKMVNGAVGTIISKATARATNTNFDPNVYPTGCKDDDSFVIVKVTNNKNNRGGIFLAYNALGTDAYIGFQHSGNAADPFTWKKFTFTEDLDYLTTRLTEHITNTNNPHRVKKAQVGLKDVENLPVISRAEVLCLESVRKYVTFDALLLFIKSFMIAKNGGELDPRNAENGALENVQILYAPVSNCACDNSAPATTATPTPTPTGTGTPTPTPTPTVTDIAVTILNDADILTSKTALLQGESTNIICTFTGVDIGATYYLDYMVRTNLDNSFNKDVNTNLPSTITVSNNNPQIEFTVANFTGSYTSTASYVKITDSRKNTNTINTNQILLTFDRPNGGNTGGGSTSTLSLVSLTTDNVVDNSGLTPVMTLNIEFGVAEQNKEYVLIFNYRLADGIWKKFTTGSSTITDLQNNIVITDVPVVIKPTENTPNLLVNITLNDSATYRTFDVQVTVAEKLTPTKKAISSPLSLTFPSTTGSANKTITAYWGSSYNNDWTIDVPRNDWVIAPLNITNAEKDMAYDITYKYETMTLDDAIETTSFVASGPTNVVQIKINNAYSPFVSMTKTQINEYTNLVGTNIKNISTIIKRRDLAVPNPVSTRNKLIVKKKGDEPNNEPTITVGYSGGYINVDNNNVPKNVDEFFSVKLYNFFPNTDITVIIETKLTLGSTTIGVQEVQKKTVIIKTDAYGYGKLTNDLVISRFGSSGISLPSTWTRTFTATGSRGTASATFSSRYINVD